MHILGHKCHGSKPSQMQISSARMHLTGKQRSCHLKETVFFPAFVKCLKQRQFSNPQKIYSSWTATQISRQTHERGHCKSKLQKGGCGLFGYYAVVFLTRLALTGICHGFSEKECCIKIVKFLFEKHAHWHVWEKFRPLVSQA